MRERTSRKIYVSRSGRLEPDDLLRMLASSFLGILACATCIVGLTMAWFTSGVEKQSGKISTNNFVLASPELNPTALEWDGAYHLEPNQTYTIELTGNEKVGKGIGYARIIIIKGDEVKNYITKPLTYSLSHKSYDYLQFQIVTGSEKCELRIESGWGDPGDKYADHETLSDANRTIYTLSTEEIFTSDDYESEPQGDLDIDNAIPSDELTTDIFDTAEFTNELTTDIPDTVESTDELKTDVPDTAEPTDELTTDVPDTVEPTDELTTDVPDMLQSTGELTTDIPNTAEPTDELPGDESNMG